MGGIIRCIKNEYNLDQLENEINKTDNDSGLDEIFNIVKQNNNPYIDDKKTNFETNHYSDNFLKKIEVKRSYTFSFPQTSKKILK